MTMFNNYCQGETVATFNQTKFEEVMAKAVGVAPDYVQVTGTNNDDVSFLSVTFEISAVKDESLREGLPINHFIVIIIINTN